MSRAEKRLRGKALHISIRVAGSEGPDFLSCPKHEWRRFVRRIRDRGEALTALAYQPFSLIDTAQSEQSLPATPSARAPPDPLPWRPQEMNGSVPIVETLASGLKNRTPAASSGTRLSRGVRTTSLLSKCRISFQSHLQVGSGLSWKTARLTFPSPRKGASCNSASNL
jgi:hypothetical protein